MGDMADHIEWANGGDGMGDMADFSLFNDGYDGNDYGSDEDCYGHDGSYDYHKLGKLRHVTCKNCGTERLHWTDYKGKWYLFNEKSQQHVCEKRKQDAAKAFRHLF